jgi:hypothetical protein
MFGFLVGWGVFWMLLWVASFIAGVLGNSDNLTGLGVLGTVVSVIFLIAVFVGKLVTGL